VREINLGKTYHTLEPHYSIPSQHAKYKAAGLASRSLVKTSSYAQKRELVNGKCHFFFRAEDILTFYIARLGLWSVQDI